MASPPSSDLAFFTPVGLTLAAPREWEPAVVVLASEHPPTVEALRTVRLDRNDGPLPLRVQVLPAGPALVADWPRSGCGTYRLVRDDGRCRTATVVTVRPYKLSEGAFEQLLDDLVFRLPAAVAWRVQGLGGLAGVRIRPPATCTFEQELVRLRRAVEGTDARAGLGQILRDVARRPHQVLAGVEEVVPLARARRPHPSRFPAYVQAETARRRGDTANVPDQRVRKKLDVPENRLVRSYTDQVEARLGRLAILAQAGAARHVEATRRLLEVVRVGRRGAAFLDEVTPLPHAPNGASQVLLRVPAYRAALAGYLALHQEPAVVLDDSGLDAPLENLPRLYELWGTLLVLEALLEVAQETRWRIHRQALFQADTRGLSIRFLFPGKPLVELVDDAGCRVTLKARARYDAAGPELFSASFPQVPDVAVEVRSPGMPPAVWLFDPKYKFDGARDPDDRQAKKEDIDKMHSYRDAIRDVAGRRVVRHAAILYPGPYQAFGEGLEALPALPGEGGLEERLRGLLSAALGAR